MGVHISGHRKPNQQWADYIIAAQNNNIGELESIHLHNTELNILRYRIMTTDIGDYGCIHDLFMTSPSRFCASARHLPLSAAVSPIPLLTRSLIAHSLTEHSLTLFDGGKNARELAPSKMNSVICRKRAETTRERS